MSLSDFARLLDVRPASVSNHKKSGVVPKHYAVVAVLLGHLGDEHFEFRDLLHKHGVSFQEGKQSPSAPAQLTLISSRSKR